MAEDSNNTNSESQEQVPPVNQVSVYDAGPYGFSAQLVISGSPAGVSAALCRCGASKNKPFCDGSHRQVGFNDAGEPPTGKTDPLPAADGPLSVDPLADGPLKVAGNHAIVSNSGRPVALTSKTSYLCRCGASNNKPFCDGSHTRIGFKA